MTIISGADVESWMKAGGFTGTVHQSTTARVAAATESALIRWCGRSFEKIAAEEETSRVYQQTTKQQWRGIVSPYEAIVHDIWDTTNLVIETDDADSGTYGTTWSESDYTLEPLNQLEGDSYSPYWRIRATGARTFRCSHRNPALRVTAAWGWAAVPDDVTQAALIKAARVFSRKDSPQGVAGFGEFGVVRVSRNQDPDVVDLLSPYRHPRLIGALIA